MFQAVGILSGVLAALSYIPYTRDTVQKREKPERASWLIWSVAVTIAFFTQHAKGASWSLWFPGIDALGCFITLGLAIKYGRGGLLKRDLAALLVLGAGLLIWAFTDNALYALILTIATVAASCGVTIRKTLEDPHSKTCTAWLIMWAASLCAVISVGKLDIALLLYPAYIFISTGAIVGAIFFGRGVMKPIVKPAVLPLSENTNMHGPSMLGEPYWSSNPVQVGASTTLSVPIEHAAASILGGEYVGVRDPGVGKGNAMGVVDGHLKTVITPNVVGGHPLYIRAKDTSGSWSEFSATTLTVLPTPGAVPAFVDNTGSTTGSMQT